MFQASVVEGSGGWDSVGCDAVGFQLGSAAAHPQYGVVRGGIAADAQWDQSGLVVKIARGLHERRRSRRSKPPGAARPIRSLIYETRVAETRLISLVNPLHVKILRHELDHRQPIAAHTPCASSTATSVTS
jgi:hypothetical protein